MNDRGGGEHGADNDEENPDDWRRADWHNSCIHISYHLIEKTNR